MRRKINPEHLDVIKDFVNSSPYLNMLNVKLTSLDFGEAVIEVELEEKHLNPFGGIHAGLYASVIDTAAYWSAYCDMDESQGYTTIDTNVSNLSSISKGKLRVVGKTIKVGRSICLCEVFVYNESDRLIAHGTAKLMLLQNGTQSLAQILAHSHVSIPARFLD